jgi:hypothetical protein
MSKMGLCLFKNNACILTGRLRKATETNILLKNLPGDRQAKR